MTKRQPVIAALLLAATVGVGRADAQTPSQADPQFLEAHTIGPQSNALPYDVPFASGLTDAGVAAYADEQVVGQPAGPPPTPRHTGIHALFRDLGADVTHLPSKENLFWAAVGGGLALAVHPADDNVNHAMVNSTFAHNFFKPGAYLGQSYTLFAVSAAVYAAGRIKAEPKVSHMGMDLLQAVAVSEGLTQVLKYSTRRERPDGSAKTSFPSGHAADTFAFATALERHFGWKGAVPAYIFASYVAISRLPANRHWLSDAVFGSSVGIIAGRTVTRHGREFPITVAAVPGGAALMFARSYK
jgi:hypothetical protein